MKVLVVVRIGCLRMPRHKIYNYAEPIKIWRYSRQAD